MLKKIGIIVGIICIIPLLIIGLPMGLGYLFFCSLVEASYWIDTHLCKCNK